MADYPALPLWTDAYLADTAARLTVEEHGVYLLLMQLAWREGGSLPPEQEEIVGWVKGVCRSMHGRTAKRVVETVLARFWKHREDGRWYQKRLEKELKHVRKTSETRSKSAAIRWAKERKNKALADASGIHRARDSTPTPTPSIQTLSLVPPSEPESLNPSHYPNGGVGGAPGGAKSVEGGSPKAKPQNKGTRLDESWTLNDEGRTWCKARLEFSDALIEETEDEFRDWALSASGPSSIKRNWNRAFKGWARRKHERLRTEARREEAWRHRSSTR